MIKRKEYFAAIGEIGMLHANIVFVITGILSLLISNDRLVSSAVTDEIRTVNAKLALIKKLYRMRITDEDLLKRTSDFISTFEIENQRRNDFLHDIWVLGDVDEGNGDIQRVKYKKKYGNSISIH